MTKSNVGRHLLVQADCMEYMATLADNSIDSVISDPPYGLNFMNSDWDASVPGLEWAKELLRVCKPGSHALLFSGTRTYHRLTVALEDAGWEVRDCLCWMYGSGFPKNHNISKSIDREAGAEREVIGTKRGVGGENMNDIVHGRDVRTHEDEGGKGVGAYGTGAKQVAIDVPITAPATEEAKKYEGFHHI